MFAKSEFDILHDIADSISDLLSLTRWNFRLYGALKVI